MTDLEERFWSKVDKDGPSGCWLWTTSTRKGYGQISSHGHNLVAHRLSYEWLVGPIPEGMTLDHLCRVRRCVNPAHLEPVTMAENIRRGISPSAILGRLTRCKRGHPLSGDNLYIKPSDGSRECRTCRAVRQSRRRAA